MNDIVFVLIIKLIFLYILIIFFIINIIIQMSVPFMIKSMMTAIPIDDYDYPIPMEVDSESDIIPVKKIVRSKARKATISKVMRANVWDFYIGEEKGIAKCLCCDRSEITQFQFECGHVISEYNGGDTTLENLRPVCSMCNKSMGKMNMDEFIIVILHKNLPKNWYGFTKK